MTSTATFSLRTKIMGMLMGLSLLLGVAILFLFEQTAKTSEEEKLKTYDGYAVGMSESISAQFFERYGDVQAFAMNDVMIALNPQHIAEELNQYAALYGIYDLILMADMNGRYIASNTKAPDGNPIKIEDLKKKDFSKTPWFKAAVAQQYTEDKEKGFVGTLVEDAQIDELTSLAYGKQMYGNSFTSLVKDVNGHPIAVITARPGFRWVESEFVYLYKRLAREGLKSTEINLLNKSGVVLVNYDPQRNNGSLDIKRDFDHTIYKENLAAAGFTAAKEALAGHEGALFEVQEGVEQAFGYSPVRGSKFVDSIGWEVVVQVERHELTANLISARKNFWFSVLAALIIAGIASVWFANSLSKSLLKLASDLSTYSLDVANTSGEIAESSKELSAASADQASALQQTVAAIDEISAMVNKNAETARKSAEVSQGSETTALNGKQTVQKMVTAISEISDANGRIKDEIDLSNQQIGEIVRVISEIGNKTKVINDIVFQTKLLSFNASVEAARAGEHGKGFAVVAEEVGNLAQMSGNAAREISSMLDSSIEKVEKIVSSSKEKIGSLMLVGTDKVDTGIKTAEACGKVLDDILENVSNVNQLVSEISTASQEQAAGVQEVTKAMNQLDQATQQNLGVAQQSSSSADSLSSRSDSLKNVSFDLLKLIGADQIKKSA